MSGTRCLAANLAIALHPIDWVEEVWYPSPVPAEPCLEYLGATAAPRIIPHMFNPAHVGRLCTLPLGGLPATLALWVRGP